MEVTITFKVENMDDLKKLAEKLDQLFQNKSTPTTQPPPPPDTKPIVNIPINIVQDSFGKDSIGLRIYRSLRCVKIRTITQLISYSESEILNIFSIGEISLRRIRSVLASLGLKLRTK